MVSKCNFAYLGYGVPRKSVDGCCVNRKTSGIVKKSGVGFVVENTRFAGFEVGVIFGNLNLGE